LNACVAVKNNRRSRGGGDEAVSKQFEAAVFKDYVLVIAKQSGREYTVSREAWDDQEWREFLLKEIRRMEGEKDEC